MPDWLASALFAGVVAALTSRAAIRVELRWLRRDVDAAHERLDAVGAPAIFPTRKKQQRAG